MPSFSAYMCIFNTREYLMPSYCLKIKCRGKFATLVLIATSKRLFGDSIRASLLKSRFAKEKTHKLRFSSNV